MLKKFADPTIKIDMFDEEKIMASTYIQAVQDYIQAAASSEALKKRMELFEELLTFEE